MLTATFSPFGHFAAVAQASRITHSPSETMDSIFSAMGMKVPGGTMPFLGWRQRVRASKPVIRLLSRLTTG